MSEQRHTFTVDTQVAVHGCSDDTFGVYWGTSGIDDDDCAQEWERWVRVHFPDGSGQVRGVLKYRLRLCRDQFSTMSRSWPTQRRVSLTQRPSLVFANWECSSDDPRRYLVRCADGPLAREGVARWRQVGGLVWTGFRADRHLRERVALRAAWGPSRENRSRPRPEGVEARCGERTPWLLRSSRPRRRRSVGRSGHPREHRRVCRRGSGGLRRARSPRRADLVRDRDSQAARSAGDAVQEEDHRSTVARVAARGWMQV